MKRKIAIGLLFVAGVMVFINGSTVTKSAETHPPEPSGLIAILK